MLVTCCTDRDRKGSADVDVLIYLLLPAVAMVAGGAFAAYRPFGQGARSLVQHFAAGVVFAAVAGELLPDVMEEHRPIAVVIGFAAGIALLLGIRQATEAGPEARAAGVSRGFVIAVALDIAIDGLLLGIGFAAGTETGILIAIALTLEVLSLGLALAGELSQGGQGPGRIIALMMGLALILIAGAVAGKLLLGGLSGSPYAAMLGFGSAALLYLVTEELLVEAHEVPETPAATAMFFVGFLALLVMMMVV